MGIFDKLISKHNLSKDDFSKGYGYVALIFEELKGIKINDIKIVPQATLNLPLLS